jgi:uncharacterized protein (DUF427 family)
MHACVAVSEIAAVPALIDAAEWRARLLQGTAMSETITDTWIVTALGASVLLFALLSAVQHYRRERMRAELLKNLDHHSWCRWQGKPLRVK